MTPRRSPPRIEAMLPVGVRPRQLWVRTLLLGMLIVALRRAAPRTSPRARGAGGAAREGQAAPRRDRAMEGRRAPAHLPPDRAHLRPPGPGALKEQPDGQPSQALRQSWTPGRGAVQALLAPPSSSALDWTDLESFARPPHGSEAHCADTEGAWGHRTASHPGRDDRFFGYYLQAATIVKEESGEEVPELVRRIHSHPPSTTRPPRSCPCSNAWQGKESPRRSHRRLRLLLPRASDLRGAAADARRQARAGPAPQRPRQEGHTHGRRHLQRQPLLPSHTTGALRALAARARRQPRANGRTRAQVRGASPLQALPNHRLRPGRLPARGLPRSPRQTALPTTSGLNGTLPRAPHDPRSPRTPARLLHPTDNHRAGVRDSEDATEARLPLRRAPTLLRPALRGRAHLRARLTTPQPSTSPRGWCRLMGLTPNALLTATVIIARNLRIADAFNARQAENERRAARGLAPRRRRKRRRTTHEPTDRANAPPPIAA